MVLLKLGVLLKLVLGLVVSTVAIWVKRWLYELTCVEVKLEVSYIDRSENGSGISSCNWSVLLGA